MLRLENNIFSPLQTVSIGGAAVHAARHLALPAIDHPLLTFPLFYCSYYHTSWSYHGRETDRSNNHPRL